jgi:hypothetical protein
MRLNDWKFADTPVLVLYQPEVSVLSETGFGGMGIDLAANEIVGTRSGRARPKEQPQ